MKEKLTHWTTAFALAVVAAGCSKENAPAATDGAKVGELQKQVANLRKEFVEMIDTENIKEFYTYMSEGWPPKPDNWEQIIEDNLNGSRKELILFSKCKWTSPLQVTGSHKVTHVYYQILQNLELDR